MDPPLSLQMLSQGHSSDIDCCNLAGKVMSKCGKCARYMRLISARPSRLYCGTCEEVFDMPQVCHTLEPDAAFLLDTRLLPIICNYRLSVFPVIQQ